MIVQITANTIFLLLCVIFNSIVLGYNIAINVMMSKDEKEELQRKANRRKV